MELRPLSRPLSTPITIAYFTYVTKSPPTARHRAKTHATSLTVFLLVTFKKQLSNATWLPDSAGTLAENG